MDKDDTIIVGIDASNIRQGGGITHLIELLNVTEPSSLGIKKIVIWGSQATLNALNDRSWLCKRNASALNKGLFYRSFWQLFSLSGAARVAECDVLLIPGGSYAGSFRPVVSMSRNLLPFEIDELLRYGWSLRTLKLLALRLTMSRSFRTTDGTIFLTQYARKAVLAVTGELRSQTRVIPHGINARFNGAPKGQRAISEYDDKNPYRILYVSNIDNYKHQWNVVEAVKILRNNGLPVVLDLVGSAYQPALKRLNKTLSRLDPERIWVNYQGVVVFNELHQFYLQSDLGVFASSCENMPNILLEIMASGLPIACSSYGPMPEVLGNSGVFFDPEKTKSIAKALSELINSPQLRFDLSQASYERVQQYSWRRCAEETFGFLNSIVKY